MKTNNKIIIFNCPIAKIIIIPYNTDRVLGNQVLYYASGKIINCNTFYE